ncbi:uncharacterized protein J4E92_008675 [Alternaria infectoria]|uniref:uncharacterized protein n=1 Tax=Alternaria infectoria TaxID=45303 RepID=UPI00221F07FA|nr:uncharacterized protein J4E92_008675 [Alternaria infectoria]KAI4919031.1 hypothetical protein J4E92_008675 [Alternaria infectoria]
MAPPKLQENGILSLEDTPADIVEIIERNAAESPLLNLPAELRNRIAEMVCGTTSDCVWFLGHGQHIVTSSKIREVTSSNPLKAVCKTLRAETIWLEMRVNRVKVEASIFVRMHQKKDLRLRQIKSSIEIAVKWQDNFAPEMKRRRAIFEYAKENPDIKIGVRISNWKFVSAIMPLQYFVCVGWAIEKSLRGKKWKFTGCQKALVCWTDGKANEELDLPNLKFFPLVGKFDEDMFRQMVTKGEEAAFARKLIKLYGSEDEAVAAVKVWFVEGV